MKAEKNNLSSRQTTDAVVSWKPEPWKKPGDREAAQQTPDVTAMLQAVVDRDDWEKGNAVVFLLSGKGKRVAGAYKGSSAPAAELVIEAEVGEPRDQKPGTPHTVRLHFCEPDALSPGARVFDIQLNGETVEKSFDIMKLVGNEQTSLVREYEGVQISDELTITFVAQEGASLINGVEIIRAKD